MNQLTADHGEKDLSRILQRLNPKLNTGAYVFCTVPPEKPVSLSEIILYFREEEGSTLVLTKEDAAANGYPIHQEMAWKSKEYI